MNTTCEDVSLVQCCRLGETGWCCLPPGLLQQVNINRGGRTGDRRECRTGTYCKESKDVLHAGMYSRLY